MSGPYHNPNLWRQKREPYGNTSYFMHENSFNTSFDDFPFNQYLDIHMKDSALKVSQSLVSLISYSDEQPLFWASGFFIESYNVNGIYFNTVLTSASLLKVDALRNSLPDKFKVEVILPSGDLCSGDVVAFDTHFNVAAIRIQLHASLPAANLRCVDDSIQTDHVGLHLPENSDRFKLLYGNPLLALGRYHVHPYELMVAPGKFGIERHNLDCGELLRLHGKITLCGIGGPMVNPYGEVIGINFYAESFVPFLPINVVCKWWEDVKGSRSYPHRSRLKPWLGMQVSRLFSAPGNELEQILNKFPDIAQGIIVEEDTKDSPAALAGICRNDVIVEFAGENVGSCLKLLELSWDKAGKKVDFIVLRSSNGARLNLSMLVGGLNTEQYNRWPLPEKRLRHVDAEF